MGKYKQGGASKVDNQEARWASNVTRWRISLPYLPYLSSSTSPASSSSSRGRTLLHPTIHSFQDISQKPQLISIQSRLQYRRYPMMMVSFHLIQSQKNSAPDLLFTTAVHALVRIVADLCFSLVFTRTRASVRDKRWGEACLYLHLLGAVPN